MSGHANDDVETEEVVQLGEPERRRLLELAADVLGRLPAEQVPGSLRAVARFTPAKRARLGAAPLAAALDGDEGFRSAVADVVTAAAPELVRQLHDGASTTASDPIDVAVVAYLVRPEGWKQILRSAADRAGRTDNGDAAELTKLRTELASARTELRAHTRRTSSVERDVQRDADRGTELAELRKQLRVAMGDVRAVTRERDEARSEVADAREAARAARSADATHEAEVRRLRAKITELERSAGTARRESRRQRDLDVARLTLLLDTMTEAAAGLRRELSLPQRRVQPADTVDAITAEEAAGGGTRSARDAAAVERLLALPHAHLIVDGYNVTKTGYGELPLADQRSRLIGALAALVGRAGAETTVAFDGGARPPSQPPSPRGVRVLFSAVGETADDLIRRLVAAEPAGRPVVVATTDQAIVLDVLRAGAYSVPSAVLLEALG